MKQIKLLHWLKTPTIFGNLSARYEESIEFISASTECKVLVIKYW